MTTPVADFTGNNASTPFIVFASSEGAWGNDLVVQYANFNDNEKEFDIIVHAYSIPEGQTQPILTVLESWTVSRSYKTDEFGKQMFIEDRINGNSDYIYVVNNPAVADDVTVNHYVDAEEGYYGDGTTKSFSGNLEEVTTQFLGRSIDRGSVEMDLTGDGEQFARDDGRGRLFGPNVVSGTIDYNTGAFTLELETAPSNSDYGEYYYSYTSYRRLASGTDGSTPALSDVVAALAQFEDRETLPVRILIQPSVKGLNETDYVALQQEIVRICEARQDCFGILNVPSDKRTVEDVYTWVRQTQKIDSSYVGTYGPDLKIRDSYNDVVLEVPPAGFIASAFAETDAQFGPHMPPAGVDTGKLNVLGTAVNFSEGEYDLLYPENINLVLDFNSSGPTIWGARTGQVKNSHFKDINIRRLLIQIRASAREFLRNYQFKLNNDFTRLQVTERLTSYLETVDGLVDFRVICDASNNTPAIIDANELHVDIYLKPEVMIEFIQLQSVVTNSGASFEELIATGGNFA